MPKRPPYAAIPIEVVTSKTLSNSAIRLYTIIAYNSGFPFMSRQIWYQNRTLGKLIGCSLRTVERVKKELIDVGLIESEMAKNNRKCYITIRPINHVTLRALNPSINNGAKKDFNRIFMSGTTAKNGGGTPDKNGGPYMKHKNRNTTSAGAEGLGGPPVEQSMARSARVGRKKRKDEDAEERLLIRERSASHVAGRDFETLSPDEIYSYYASLINHNHIEADDPLKTKYPPVARVRYLKRIIEAARDLGITKAEFVTMLEWLLINWEKGLKFKFGKNRRMSLNIFRYNMKKIVDLYGSKDAKSTLADATSEPGVSWDDLPTV